ncbi:MAG: Do family serine endopeptidase [Acidovorax sp.]|jgi:serine protease Do|nr:Do family serine endopeptidase [Acidovorax sp.]
MDKLLSTPRRLVLALVAAGAIGAAGAGLVSGMHHSAQASAPVATATASSTATSVPTVGMPDFAAITRTNAPAVVNISVVGDARAMQMRGDDSADEDNAPQIDPNDPFFEFFRRFGLPGMPGGQAQPRDTPARGEGSGFIVSSDGLILTNAHVVYGAKDVSVKLSDRREFQAKVLGLDPKTDVAVLRIQAKDLPVVKLGNTKDLQVGEWVLAIGAPFGFENSVTAGVVSAKGRSLPDDSLVPFLQTDVAINPGNSGGPLFNARGEVVGINSQIYTRSGGYQGVSFAIPIELASQIQQQIVAHGKVEHARLGVAVQEVNQGFADSFGLSAPEGALVSSVQDGSPAAKAGLQPGDVVQTVNGQRIVSSGDLPAYVGQRQPGEKVQLQVWRQGKAVQLTATLANADDGKTQKAAKAEVEKGKLGLALRPLTPQEQQQVGVQGGLLIGEVSGPAAQAGVAPGDVLLSINNQAVSSVEGVQSAMAKVGKTVALLVMRGGDKIFVPVHLG